MDVVSVWPRRGAVKKRVGLVVGIGNVGVAEADEWSKLRLEGMQIANRNLNINHRFGSETRDCCRANVIYAYSRSSKAEPDPRRLSLEFVSPPWVVWHNDDGIVYQHLATPSCPWLRCTQHGALLRLVQALEVGGRKELIFELS